MIWKKNSSWETVQLWIVFKPFWDSQFTNKDKKKTYLNCCTYPIWCSKPTKKNHIILVSQNKISKKHLKGKKSPEKSDIPLTSQHTEEHGTPKKGKLKRKVHALWTKLWRKSQLIALQLKPRCNELIAQLKHYLPIQTVNFIERQILLHGSKSGQCRYAITDKVMVLSIFYNTRNAYILLSKLFAPPSKRTLQRSLQNTNVMPGFNDAILDTLRMKVSTMHEKDRCVSLVFNEMSLKATLV